MMKKFYLSAAIAITVASSLMFSSCLGSFALTNKVLNWNHQVSNKFVNELVFVAFWIIPVYEMSGLADLLVINSIEFWSGNNPIQASTKVIDGKDSKYLVKQDKTGYSIKDLTTQEVTRLNFNEMDKSWSIQEGNSNKEIKFMQFVDDTHVKMITPQGDFKLYETSEQGVMAYQTTVRQEQRQFAMR